MVGKDALEAAKQAALAALTAATLTADSPAAFAAGDLSSGLQGTSNNALAARQTQAEDSTGQRRSSRSRSRRKRRRVEIISEDPPASDIRTVSKNDVQPGPASKPSVSTVKSSSVHDGPSDVVAEKPSYFGDPAGIDYVLEPVILPSLSDVPSLQKDALQKENFFVAATTNANTNDVAKDDGDSEALAQLRAALARFDARASTVNAPDQRGDEEPSVYPDFASLLRLNVRSQRGNEENDTQGRNAINDGHEADDDANRDDESAGNNNEDGFERSGKEHSTEVISRKKRKEARRDLVSVLKAVCPDPSVVDPWDVTASDPLLLCSLKAVRNSVPVPINWRQKRKYLQNKRGLSKRALPLPPSIEALGIGATRDSQLATDSRKSLKQRQRERMRAKTGAAIGAADVDDRRLRQAFRQLGKPSLTPLGEVYFELKELEVDSRSFVPGTLSDELREALGIQKNDPPPWIVAMQRWGPPPGWPGLRVPGVNAPIPAGSRFGYQAGGWGKPPIDQTGRPMYGDVFDQGLVYEVFDERFDVSHETKTRRWGSVQSVQEASSDEQAAEDELDEKLHGRRDEDEAEVSDDMGANARANDGAGGDRRWSGENVVGTGKGYQVLAERREWSGGSGLMASSHLYDMEGAKGGNERYGRSDERVAQDGGREGERERECEGEAEGDGRNKLRREGLKNQRFKF